jgi:uncharacterized protein (DUF58 family)
MQWFQPGERLKARLRDWALRRQGPDRLPLRLAPRRVYIVPTAAGWTFAVAVGVMFLAGMNYGNGLALLFTFWLAGFALVAMVQTQRALAGAVVRAAHAGPAFAGDTVELRLAIGSPRTELADLALDSDDDTARSAAAAEATSELRLLLPAQRRGRWRAPPLRLRSTAPFGLFRTWAWLDLEVATLVYPRPVGTLPMPQIAGDRATGSELARGQEELAWLRDFREGDSPRGVAWKAYARGQPLLVREYHGAASQRREFDYATLTGLDVEARLSQLARWIVDAEAHGEHWVLRLPGSAPLAGAGRDHRTTCLARLALHGLPGETA